MYKNKKWLDEVKDADTGEIMQEGTDMSAGNFNNMENGITDAHVATALTMIYGRQNRDRMENFITATSQQFADIWLKIGQLEAAQNT